MGNTTTNQNFNFDSFEAFCQSHSFSNKQTYGNLGSITNTLINRLNGQTSDTITIAGVEYKLVVVENATQDLNFIDSDKPLLIIANTDDNSLNLTGSIHDDIIFANGFDHIYSSAGDDIVYADNTNFVHTGHGDDIVNANNSVGIYTGYGNDNVNAMNTNHIYTSYGDDTINAWDVGFIESEAGNDNIYAENVTRFVDGGADNDTLSGANVNAFMNIEQNNLGGTTPPSGTGTFSSIHKFLVSLGLSSNSQEAINSAIEHLKAQGLETITIGDTEYKLVLEANTTSNIDLITSDKPVIVFATTQEEMINLKGTIHNDIIIASGFEHIYSSAGDDIVISDNSKFIHTGHGDDIVNANNSVGIYTGYGNDMVNAMNSNHICSGYGDDVVNAYNLDFILTEDGNDIINAANVNRLVDGGDGDDSLLGFNIKEIKNVETENTLNLPCGTYKGTPAFSSLDINKIIENITAYSGNMTTSLADNQVTGSQIEDWISQVVMNNGNC